MRKLAVLALAGLLLLPVMTWAQAEVKVEKKVVKTEPCGRAEPCDDCKAGKACEHDMGMMQTGMMGGMMSEMPPEVSKKLAEQRLKSFKEIAALRTDIAYKHMEMKLLWQDEKPDQSKILAKVKEISQARLALCERQIKEWFAAYNLVPESHRQHFRKGMGGMGMPGMKGRMACGQAGRMGCGMGCSMGEGMECCPGGMGMGQQKKIVRIQRGEGPMKMKVQVRDSDDDDDEEDDD